MTRNNNNLKISTLALGLMCFLTISTWAASTKITYQGQLRENGVPVTDNKDMVFGIFTSSAGGTAVWTSGSQTVSVISGLFRTLLEPTGVNWEATLYLEIEVEGTTLSPREELTASPYAINTLLLSGKAYTTAATAPTSPSVGDLWFNTTSTSLNIWSGSSWDQISSGGSGGGTVTVENNDTVIEASASRIDFSGTYFSVQSGPSGEANVSISTNSITDANISTGAAIQLSKLEKDPSQSSTINTSTNPVDWTQLKSVPVGFSDGVDNTGGGSPVIEENDAVVDAAATNIDFLGANFDVTSSPAGEANISLDASSVTLQGNSFNAASQLVQLNGSSELPAVSATNLTNIPAANLTGSIANSSIDSSSITKQGNTFNAANRLVQLDGSGNLPGLDGSALTGLTPGSISAGSLPSNVIASSIAVSSVYDPSIVSMSATKLTAGNMSGQLTVGSTLTVSGNSFSVGGSSFSVDSGVITIAGGTGITGHLSATSSLDFGILGALTCESFTVTVTGAADGDTVYLGIPNSLASVDATLSIFNAYVSAADTVTVKRCGLAAGITNPSAATVRVDVWKH